MESFVNAIDLISYGAICAEIWSEVSQRPVRPLHFAQLLFIPAADYLAEHLVTSDSYKPTAVFLRRDRSRRVRGVEITSGDAIAAEGELSSG